MFKINVNSILRHIALILSGLLVQVSVTAAEQPLYQAQVKFTEFGIPHITAGDYGSLGYAEGYVAADDHLCNISYAVMKAQAKLAEHLGKGANNQHLIHDLVIKALEIPNKSRLAFQRQSTQVKQMYKGYAAGINRYIEENQNQFSSWCKNATWIKKVTAEQLFARALYIAQTLPYLSAAIYHSQPPEVTQSQSSANQSLAPKNNLLINEYSIAQLSADSQLTHLGSNAWAIGKEYSQSGRGLLLANPHYPWFGTNRFWEKHLTIPGELDVYGVSLTGIPNVALGFNEHIGWSHTVSNSQRISLYRLSLATNDPTSYLVDGNKRKMRSQLVEVNVKQAEGPPLKTSHTVWFSHLGPMITMPGLPWDKQQAFTVIDSNADNHYFMQQWFDMGQAKSIDELINSHKKHNAMPWVNTIASSSKGDAVYLDNSSVINLSDEAITRWKKSYQQNGQVAALYNQRKLMLLDGSDSRMFPVSHTTSPLTFATPFDKRPLLKRDDYVFNANDSYWLTNPKQPLNGYSPLYGSTNTARSLRTRQNIKHLESLRDGKKQGLFTLQDLKEKILSNESYSATIYQSDLINACGKAVTENSHRVIKKESATHYEQRLEASCKVIKGYNGVLNLDSKGAVLFREWQQAYQHLSRNQKTSINKMSFKKATPVTTPSGLGSERTAVEALMLAANQLESLNIALDATLNDTQVNYRGSNKTPIHGGFGFEGVANMIDNRAADTIGPIEKAAPNQKWSRLTKQGYLVSGGTSFLMALEFTASGPQAEALLTYGQSGDPSSPKAVDQTKLFSQKKWRPIYYNINEVNKNTLHEIKLSNH